MPDMILLVLFLEKSKSGRDRVEWYEYMGSRWDLINTILALPSLVFIRHPTVLQKCIPFTSAIPFSNQNNMKMTRLSPHFIVTTLKTKVEMQYN